MMAASDRQKGAGEMMGARNGLSRAASEAAALTTAAGGMALSALSSLPVEAGEEWARGVRSGRDEAAGDRRGDAAADGSTPPEPSAETQAGEAEAPQGPPADADRPSPEGHGTAAPLAPEAAAWHDATAPSEARGNLDFAAPTSPADGSTVPADGSPAMPGAAIVPQAAEAGMGGDSPAAASGGLGSVLGPGALANLADGPDESFETTVSRIIASIDAATDEPLGAVPTASDLTEGVFGEANVGDALFEAVPDVSNLTASIFDETAVGDVADQVLAAVPTASELTGSLLGDAAGVGVVDHVLETVPEASTLTDAVLDGGSAGGVTDIASTVTSATSGLAALASLPAGLLGGTEDDEAAMWGEGPDVPEPAALDAAAGAFSSLGDGGLQLDFLGQSYTDIADPLDLGAGSMSSGLAGLI